jgi:hypothetical protein
MSNDVNYDRNSNKTLTNYNPLDTAVSVLNTTRHLTLGYNLQTSMNTKYLMFTLSGKINYNHVWQAKKTNSPSVYASYNIFGDIKLFLPFDLMITTDYQINLNTGYSQGFNKSYALWNATATKELLKSRRAQLKFQIFDILKQNQSVRRSITGRNISDTRSTILPQYFIFTLVYNYKNFKQVKGQMNQGLNKPNKALRQLGGGGGKNRKGF